MDDVTPSSETDACSRPGGSGHVLLKAIALAGFVAFALLIAVGLPPASDRSAGGGHHGAAVAQAQATGYRAKPSPSPTHSWIVAEIDDVSGDPRIVEPVQGARLLPSATGFRPRGNLVPQARDSAPPDRPPRRA